MSTLTMSIDSIIEETEKHLGEAAFIPASKLIDLGFYGSSTSLSNAIKNGSLPAIKISEHRFVVPRSAIAHIIRKNFCSQSQE